MCYFHVSLMLINVIYFFFQIWQSMESVQLAIDSSSPTVMSVAKLSSIRHWRNTLVCILPAYWSTHDNFLTKLNSFLN